MSVSTLMVWLPSEGVTVGTRVPLALPVPVLKLETTAWLTAPEVVRKAPAFTMI